MPDSAVEEHRSRWGARPSKPLRCDNVPGGFDSYLFRHLNTRQPNASMKRLGPEIWTLDGPQVVFAGAPMNTRMTLIRLNDGRLWVHSPIPLDDPVRAALDTIEFEDIAALVAPKKYHHMFIASWSKSYPTAQLFVEPALQKKVPALAGGIPISDEAPELYAAEIDQVVFSGNPAFQEAVFFHKQSRTLLLTDLVINLRVDRMPLLPRLYLRFEQVAFPDGGIPRLFRWFALDRATMRMALEKVLSWNAEKITFCHGEPIETDATTFMRQQFQWLLE